MKELQWKKMYFVPLYPCWLFPLAPKVWITLEIIAQFFNINFGEKHVSLLSFHLATKPQIAFMKNKAENYLLTFLTSSTLYSIMLIHQILCSHVIISQNNNAIEWYNNNTTTGFSLARLFCLLALFIYYLLFILHRLLKGPKCATYSALCFIDA